MWGHCHTDGTAQNHWRLSKHRFNRLITGLAIGLLGITGIVLRLAIGLCIVRVVRGLLPIAGVGLPIWLLARGLVRAVLHGSTGNQGLAATVAESGPCIIMRAAIRAKSLVGSYRYGCGSLSGGHALPAVGAEGAAARHFYMTGGTLLRGRLHNGCDGRGVGGKRLSAQRAAAMHTEGRADFDATTTARAVCGRGLCRHRLNGGAAIGEIGRAHV